VLGASGNVGRLVVSALLREHTDALESVVTINRRDVDELFESHPLLDHQVVDMSSGAALAAACSALLDPVDVVVATMGLGSGKGALEQWHKVEVELPTAFATAARDAGARRAVLLTSVGADIERTFAWVAPHVARGQYFHIKGLVERNFTEAGFAEGVDVFRPSNILGTTHLPAFVDRLLPMLDWVAPPRWRCIHIEQLAAAMAQCVVQRSDERFTVWQGTKLFDASPGARKSPVEAG
jgi:nucleoside-diphosphate-sugar epimerase